MRTLSYQRRSAQRGITLLELMVSVLIGMLLIIAAAVSLSQVDTVNTRTAARFVSSTLRFAYDRARSTGRDHRFVFDLDAEGGTQVKFEVASKGKQLLPRNLDEAWEQHNALAEGEEEEARLRAQERTTIGGLSKGLLTLDRPTGPQWTQQRLRTKRAQKRLDKSVRLVKSIFVPRLNEEITEGKVAIHVWGGGRIERVALYIADREDQRYTLVTYPLTGRVKILEGHQPLQSDLVNADDLGQPIEER